MVNEFADCDLRTVVECRVGAVLLRAAATGERLLHSVEAAATGGGVLPPQLLGDLLKHVEMMRRDVLAPGGVNATGLTPREVRVLQMIADGLDAGEIARAVCCSERTVKNLISAMTTRLNLRNRSHSVAYAMRAGML
ncbi:helix-turn-helix transcriptional regulator [Lentzea tibetensis]|uniref:helix-turn-helix transcriptional regulator n=1 Tax=Lentzea tibetensis TaxID=2591470 RepID=UPI001F395769|nr:LuxR C-terminal-related transcriptional regulator [Lentzea tibetensis]